MPNRYLFDTNAAIAVMNAQNSMDIFMQQVDEVHFAVTTVGELYFGAEKSGRVVENLKRVDELVLPYSVLDCTVETARIYGRILHRLRQKGRNIPPNDVWIAAVALQHNLPLLTRDGHFREVDGLSIKTW